MTERYNTLESEFENSVREYRNVWDTPIHLWTLTFTNRTLTEALAIKSFFTTKKGKATSFTWVCPLDSVEYTVRFSNDFKIGDTSYGLCNFVLNFEEDIT